MTTNIYYQEKLIARAETGETISVGLKDQVEGFRNNDYLLIADHMGGSWPMAAVTVSRWFLGSPAPFGETLKLTKEELTGTLDAYGAVFKCEAAIPESK